MHPRTSLGSALIALALIVALLQYLANAYYLYWEWWWMDIIMHFLGGLLVSGFFLWFVRFEVPVGVRSNVPLFFSAFVVIMVVGISWELFEYFTNSYAALNYTLDTTLDLCMNVVGMLIAYLIVKRV